MRYEKCPKVEKQTRGKWEESQYLREPFWWLHDFKKIYLFI